MNYDDNNTITRRFILDVNSDSPTIFNFWIKWILITTIKPDSFLCMNCSQKFSSDIKYR